MDFTILSYLKLYLLIDFGDRTLAKISCKSRNDTNVDWYVSYKLPSTTGSTAEDNGYIAVSADSNSRMWGSSESLLSTDSYVRRTLEQYYAAKNRDGVIYMLYNDDPPGEHNTDSYYAHSKGVVLFDGESGIWLVHSVPNFPPIDEYDYPGSGTRNGQSFLCVTFATHQLAAILYQLVVNKPNMYNARIPQQLIELIPLIKESGREESGSRSKISKHSSMKILKSIGGNKFWSFAKGKKYGEDLYTNMVAPELKVSMYTETWRNGGGNLESDCLSDYQVVDIKSMHVSQSQFSTNRDHSKWAISQDSGRPFVCIGDINRQISQAKRGGGTLCFLNKNIWKLFYDSIGVLTECKIPID